MKLCAMEIWQKLEEKNKSNKIQDYDTIIENLLFVADTYPDLDYDTPMEMKFWYSKVVELKQYLSFLTAA